MAASPCSPPGGQVPPSGDFVVVLRNETSRFCNAREGARMPRGELLSLCRLRLAIAVRGPRQAEVLAQGGALVVLAEQAAPLQLRDHHGAEIVVRARDIGRHHAEAVAGALGEP